MARVKRKDARLPEVPYDDLPTEKKAELFEASLQRQEAHDKGGRLKWREVIYGIDAKRAASYREILESGIRNTYNWENSPDYSPPPPPEPVIALKDCQDRVLYFIRSRNLLFGVFKAADNGFYGIREKFGNEYVFPEYHRENAAYPTVSPTEAMPERLPDDILLDDHLPGSWCLVCHKEVDYVYFSEDQLERRPHTFEDGKVSDVPGLWEHVDGSPRCKGIGGYSKANPAFFDWLKAMEKKYEFKVKEREERYEF